MAMEHEQMVAKMISEYDQERESLFEFVSGLEPQHAVTLQNTINSMTTSPDPLLRCIGCLASVQFIEIMIRMIENSEEAQKEDEHE